MSSDDADATQAIGAPPAPPGRLAQYTLVRRVGAGAMGAVYLARDDDLERPVAIKVLHPAWASDADRLQMEGRFLREARSAALLSHPNVAVVYQVGQHEGQAFIAMEWLEGSDLAQIARQGPLPWREATAAVRDAAAGLAAAHAAGLVHRDIKPSNLMRLASGQVKLVDFGLARLHEAQSDLTASGSILGTPAYLAPELGRGEPATPASDIYALACTYYHLLTGRVPFAGSHVAAVMSQHAAAPMPDPRQQVPALPEAVAQIVARGAAKSPQQRYRDGAAMCADLQAVLDGRAPAPDDDATFIVPPGSEAAPGPQAATAAVASAAPIEAPLAGNLPAEMGRFIGRELPSAQLIDLLRQARLVTLTGPGGTGKTRLAQHVARRLAPLYGDGVWLVELAALAPGGDAALAAAAVLGVRESTGHGVDDALTEHLRARRALLILDNCEHVIDSAAALAARLLAACPQLQLMCTSRQPLAAPGEFTLGVPPLAVGDESLPPAALEQVESVRLFAERARAVRPGFELGADTVPIVAQICRRLDGIPLAIELAAARVKVLSPAQIASRLDDAFKLLGGGQRSLLPRQQTLRALIDWSWELLDRPQRLALARSSVFAGEFSLEAAEAVLSGADDGDAAFDVLDALSGLVDKSLLVAVERAGAVRYALLQTIRQYAAARLDAADAVVVQRRHARHYADLVVQARSRFDSAEHAAAMAQILVEHEQARAALDAACEQRWFDIALPLGDALANYWNLAGVLVDGVARISRLLARQPPRGAETAALLRRAADLAVRCGRLELARGWLEEGLAMARASASAETVGRLLNSLGSLAFSQGAFELAERHFAEYLASCRESGDRDGQIRGVNNLAIVLRRLGRADDARTQFRHALALLEQAPNPRLVAYLKVNLGDLEEEDGEPEAARPLYAACLEVMEPLGEEWGIALARAGLGKCALALGDVALAREHLASALALLRKLGERATIAEALDQLARVALAEGGGSEARAFATEGLALRIDAGNLADLAASFDTWAAMLAGDDPEQAARLLGSAAALRSAQHAPLEAARRRGEQALRRALERSLGEAACARACAAGASADPMVLARSLIAAPALGA